MTKKGLIHSVAVSAIFLVPDWGMKPAMEIHSFRSKEFMHPGQKKFICSGQRNKFTHVKFMHSNQKNPLYYFI